ncbi:MAG: hypothetical protein MI754_15835 [Chromatiales bacterium]|nr:hypothetical protein [Chromatiales bacterium]
MKFTSSVVQWIVVLFIVAVGVGCAPKQVSIKEKTQSSEFDGYWIGRIDGTDPIQHGVAFEFGCDPINATIDSKIQNGEIRGRIVEDKEIHFSAYVNDEGFFRTVIEKGWEQGVIDRLEQTEIVLIIEGQLKSRGVNGKLTVAYAIDGYQGCETDIRFVPSKEPYKSVPAGIDQIAMTL